MSGKRVPVLDPNGRFGFVDESDVPNLPAGARALTKAQVAKIEADQHQAEAEKAVDERYDALPTAQKALGIANTVAAAALGPAGLLLHSAQNAPPVAAAFGAGVHEGVTGGLSSGLTRQAIDAIGGKAKGDAYAEQVDQQRAASPYAHGAGVAAGLGTGLVAPLGAAGEALAARGLAQAGVKGTSALSRAGIAAAEIGTRGALEGGAIGGGESAGDALLHDHEVASDKLFSAMGTGALYGGAAGAVLGGAGSLAVSGIKTGLSRVLARGADTAVEAGTEAAATKPGGAVGSMLENPTAAGKGLANDLAVDALGATKVHMRDALEHVAADQAVAKRAVGEYLNRAIIGPAAGEAEGLATGAFKAGLAGRADELLPAIQADMNGRIIQGLSGAVKGTPARVDMGAITKMFVDTYESMLKAPEKIAGAETFWKRVTTEMQALQNAGKVAADGTVDAIDAYYTRSALERQVYEVRNANGAAGDAYKSFLRQFDTETIRAIDEAGAKAGKGAVGDEIRYWKREYQLAISAEKMAKSGAERISGNNFFGLREGIALATGLATGHAILAPAAAIGFKIAKERGKAALAYALNQAAERGMLARLVGKQNSLIDRAAKGLIVSSAKGALSAAEQMPPARGLAAKALARVAAFQADPETFVNHATRETEPIAAHSPEIADGIVTRQVRTMTFLSGKIPPGTEPDPLAPNRNPKLSPNDETKLGRYAWYCERPDRFFAEVARGKLTPEGAEVAQALMPGAFDELRARTSEELAKQLARGNRLPYRQRLMLGQLLDFAATPSQRPEHAAFLQQNVVDVLPSDQGIKPGPAPAKTRGATNTPQRSILDRLEGSGLGHR